MSTATHNRLLLAAQDELVRGHGSFEMQAVAKRAQVSVGLAYHHFGSKAGLVAAVVEDFYGQLDVAAFDGFKAPSPVWAERERSRILAYVLFHYAHPLAALMVGALSRSLEAQEVEAAFTDKQLAGGAHMIAKAQAQGILPMSVDPELTIALMVGGIRQALHGALKQGPRPDPQVLADKIWAFMAAALDLKS
ncbi:TetR/AcrR family transcriptional regulator [Devosia riboflavina]